MFQANDLVDGTYLIIREIGHGGTGVVFLAYHTRLEKYVVLKKIKDNYVGTVNVRTEVDILKKLHHRYLPQVYDFVQRGQEVYTVIDYIDGYDLEYYVRCGYQFEEHEIVKWLKQLCEVLDYLHSQNPIILHSDIKPGNIMINNDGNICLIDFNISLDDAQEDITGLSSDYAAPEQLEKAMAVYRHMDSSYICLDARMDIYSMGATFYYVLSGIRPTCRYEEIYPIQYMELPYSDGLTEIVAKMMRVNPEERYQTAKEAFKALADIRKSDRTYKIARLIRYGSFVLYALCISIGIMLCAEGRRQMIWRGYNEEYHELTESYNSGNNPLLVERGVRILNNDSYRKILDDNQESEIFYVIGNGYYYSSDYKNAVTYYENAYRLQSGALRNQYFQDYLIALIKSGDENLISAEQMLEHNTQMDSSGIALVRAQIMFQKKDYAQALALADRVILNSASSQEDIHQGYLLKGEISGENGEWLEEIQYREKAAETDSSDINNLRKLAQAYTQYATQNSGLGYRDYLSKAQDIFEKLTRTAYPVLEDQINLAGLYQLDGSDTLLIKGRDLLLQLEQNNMDYRIDMNLAFIYKNLNETGRAKVYCAEALKKYSEDKDNGRQDYEQLLALKHELGI